MTGHGSRPSARPRMAGLQLMAGVLLLSLVAAAATSLTEEHALWAFFGVTGLLFIGAAIKNSGYGWDAWRWVADTAEQAMSTHSDGEIDETGRHRFALLSLVLSVCGVPLSIIATMQIWKISYVEIRPYLFAGLAVLLFVLALVAISYAPPGPNWVQRIAGLDGRALLVMIGIAIVVLGTLQFFEYNDDGSAPSDWWLGVVAIGLLVGLSGLSGARASRKRRAAANPSAENVRLIAGRVRRSSAIAQRSLRRAALDSPAEDDHRYADAARAAAAAEALGAVAQNATDRAERLESEIDEILDQVSRDARSAASYSKRVQKMAEQLRRVADARDRGD